MMIMKELTPTGQSFINLVYLPPTFGTYLSLAKGGSYHN